jgi:hypothetical protein
MDGNWEKRGRGGGMLAIKAWAAEENRKCCLPSPMSARGSIRNFTYTAVSRRVGVNVDVTELGRLCTPPMTEWEHGSIFMGLVTCRFSR